MCSVKNSSATSIKHWRKREGVRELFFENETE